ncbi:NUDIX domain-containing protein [Micromonospora sp. NPDC000207]|uniref:NUDIX domain-containing protein n=1 Tax=Micromonospora sp. NPDC000207 TaxID=3154246 RepID=UPI00332318AE
MSTYQPVDITPTHLQPPALTRATPGGWIHDLHPHPRLVTDWPARQWQALIPHAVRDGLPVNPVEVTGRIGRDLGRWGENPAADPIVVADTPDGPQVLLIRRDDCGQWAIPGGMVDPGETAPTALVRELREETGVDLSALAPTFLARTYVHDPRNTDWAWISSTAALYRLGGVMAATAGSDAEDAAWWPFDDVNQLDGVLRAAGNALYGAHRPLLDAAHGRLHG